MSVRQYIGARYVPRFSTINGGVWDNSYSYEALEIVKYGNDYYTSRKPVPAGIAISNTEYWVLTGNYNGAIGGLDERVTAIETWRDTSRFKKVLFVGDSYAVPSVVGTNTWATICASNLKLTSADYYIASQGSTGFIGLTSTTFKSLMENAPITNKSEITDIVVCGGANDAGHSITDLDTAISAFITSAKVLYPNAKIHIGMCAYLSTYSNLQYLFERVKPAYAGCQKYGAYFIANIEYALLDPTYLADGVHPTATGCLLLGNAVFKALTGSYMNVIADRNLTITPSDDVESFNYTDFREGFKNGSFQFYSGGNDNIYRGFAVVLKTDKNIGYGVDLGELDTHFVWRGGNGCGTACWLVTRLLNGDFVKNITGKLVLSQNHLFVIPDPDASLQGGWTPTLTCGKIGVVTDGFINYSA